MSSYQTTRPIKSLAPDGVNLRARQPVSPQAFTSEHWALLLAEGAVVDIDPPPVLHPIPGPQPKRGDIDAMTLAELKALADTLNVPYTWNMKADTLRERIRLHEYEG